MAALIDDGAPRQPIHSGVDEEVFNNIRELIVNRTGCPPVNADHLYTFKQHVDNFPHPCPTVADSIVGGTFPTPNPPQPIAQNLDGWPDVDPQQQAFIQAIFNHISQEDQQHAYNHFFQKLRRAPKVLEFSRFLLIYEGQLYLENEEFRETLNRHLRSIELLEQMLSSKDIMIEVLGQSSTENMKKIDDLQTQKLNLQRILCTVQQDKAQLQLDHSSLRQEHTQCLTELEDERTDKQVFQHSCQALKHENTQLQNKITNYTETITDMQVTIHEHEQNADRLTDKIGDLKQKLHRECSEKSAIYKQLMEKSEMVSELEEDRALFMMENEAQGKYFLDLKEDKLKLQRENKELKECVHKCRNILKAQYDKLISSMEVSLSRLEENLFLIKEENYKLSEVVTDLESKNSDLESKTSDLESKNSDLESKNSDLESKTSEQFITISDLESKNSDLESKNSDLESKNSDLESKNSDLKSKNSDLASKTSEQFITISDLESKNSDLESKNSDLESKNSDLESKTSEQFITISDLRSKNSDLESKTSVQSITISDLRSKNSDLESRNSDLESKNSDLESETSVQSIIISELERKATTQSNTVSDLENRHAELQQQTQRQQFFILFLVALVFTLICVQFTSPGNNAHSTS